jgi:hypothetical protein
MRLRSKSLGVRPIFDDGSFFLSFFHITPLYFMFCFSKNKKIDSGKYKKKPANNRSTCDGCYI